MLAFLAKPFAKPAMLAGAAVLAVGAVFYAGQRQGVLKSERAATEALRATQDELDRINRRAMNLEAEAIELKRRNAEARARENIQVNRGIGALDDAYRMQLRDRWSGASGG